MFDDVKEVDDGCGNYYYVNTATGAGRRRRQRTCLPSGVVAGFDEAGYAYYCHEASGATGWCVDEVLEAAKQLSPRRRTCSITVGGSSVSQPSPREGPPVAKDAPNLSFLATTTAAAADTHSRSGRGSWGRLRAGRQFCEVGVPVEPDRVPGVRGAVWGCAVSERVPTPPSIG